MAVKMLGENLNIMTKKYGTALKERDAGPLQELAKQETDAGMTWVDLNIGPAAKMGEELMSWLVPKIQEVTNLPLALDTTNIKAISAGLKVYDKGKSRPFINSIMCRPERMDALLPLAAEHDADFCALLWGPEGMPRDSDERAMLCAEIYMKATGEFGIPPERLWVDPIQTPVNVQQNQIMSALEFLQMLQDIAPGVNSTIGLSNVSNGCPEHLRPVMNQAMMLIWKRHGMASAIVDLFDPALHKICNDERSDLEEVVAKVEDEEDIDMGSLSEDQVKMVKSARIIFGRTLYSDSWLDL